MREWSRGGSPVGAGGRSPCGNENKRSGEERMAADGLRRSKRKAAGSVAADRFHLRPEPGCATSGPGSDGSNLERERTERLDLVRALLSLPLWAQGRTGPTG